MFITHDTFTRTIKGIKAQITKTGFRVGEELFGVAWDHTLIPGYTPIDTGRMVSSTIIDIIGGVQKTVWLLNEASDPDSGVFYPRKVEFGIGQRPQPWFYPAVLFAIANGEKPMLQAANLILIRGTKWLI